MPPAATPTPRRAQRRSRAAALLAALALSAWPAAATSVAVVSIRPGRSADLVIDGGSPMTVRVGETVDGITLESADREGALLRIDGVRQRVPLGVAAPSSGGGGSTAAPRTITLSLDASGHFIAPGRINGREVSFLVDTGASTIALSRRQAERLGLRYRDGRSVRMGTANGVTRGWLIVLDSVSVAGVSVRNVEATVLENDGLPAALLGMSFLNHFDMQRAGAKLRLTAR